MKTFTRGAGITLTGTFTDVSGAPIIPATAVVYLRYKDSTGTIVERTYNMVQSAVNNVWTYVWDSSVAEAGHVAGHVRTTPIPAAANDFEFNLEANSANPEPP